MSIVRVHNRDGVIGFIRYLFICNAILFLYVCVVNIKIGCRIVIIRTLQIWK